tara:strand:+ start:3851 stop:4177 length:327 start_codon:yes stop_codon:yes gene_type:complete
MITIRKNQTSTVKLFLNQQEVNEAESVQLRLNSPTHSTITLDKSLSRIGLGFYSLEVYLEEAYLLKDDTYSYQILQNGVILKYGFVHLMEGDKIINTVFDYTLDFLMS